MLAASNLDQFSANVYLDDKTGENFIENIIHTANLPSLLSKLTPHSRVFELGYGEGTITGPLIDNGFQVEIVEGSAMLCKAARDRFGATVQIHESLFEKFTPPQPYDAALALHILEHVDDPRRVIRLLASWMAPGGRVVAAVPNAQSIHRKLAVMIGLQPTINHLSPRDHMVGHQRVYTLDELVADFVAAGLEVELCFGYFLKVVPNSMMKEWSPDLLKALTLISEELPPNLLANIGVVARRPQ
jgi:2-polyprenyl-3-methyl-5-hydroxy-6-metoxy-1,4-benzoquinol methylase